MNLREKWDVVKELSAFVIEKKFWILVPVILVVLLLILIAVFIETPVLLPFFYAIF
ncbi:MAG TPA: DUF5989 family protein [Elusimicrobiota bacterium]|nr:DUF5989 family protein [Elusimicrobiota bacterium]